MKFQNLIWKNFVRKFIVKTRSPKERKLKLNKRKAAEKNKLQYRFDDKSKEYENKLHEDDDDDENTYDDCDDGDDENTYGDCDDGDDENTYDDGDDEDDYKPDYCSNSEDSDSDRSIIVPHIQKHAVVN